METQGFIMTPLLGSCLINFMIAKRTKTITTAITTKIINFILLYLTFIS